MIMANNLKRQYDLHAPETINFVIPERAMETWIADYADMRRYFIYGQSLEFDALMERIKELQDKVRKIVSTET